MAVDFGSKRIGIAVGVSEPMVATPKPYLVPTGTLAKDALQLASLAKQHEADVVVVGIPHNDENPRMANICMKLAEAIRKLGLEVEEIDESLSSVEAESRLLAMDLTAATRRSHRDAEAACILLERYFGQA